MAEELSLHECRELLDIQFNGDITLIFDGHKWYPLKNVKPTDLLQEEDPTDDDTEPIKDILISNGLDSLKYHNKRF